jgi:type I restriction enzyme R subunit
MSRHPYAESVVEEALLEWLGSLGYEIRAGEEITSEGGEREDHREVVLRGRLRAALERLNPDAPAVALDEAERRLLRIESPSLVVANRRFHRLLVDGIEVEVPAPGGGIRGVLVQALDFDQPERNDWLAVNQLSVVEDQARRRPDVVVYVNGLPLAIVELKNPADEDATIWTAFHQLQTYRAELPALFSFNELLVISDGVEARLGSLTSPSEWFLPWRTIEGDDVAAPGSNALEVLARGVFARERFLDLVRSFVVFADEGAQIAKKIAAYHQFHATRRAVETTLRASSPDGDRRAGVIWHTQGSGKTLTMVFYAGKLILHPALANPTVVVITDRNDLDGQLFGVFASCQELLRQKPVQADSREHLRDLLQVASGGVVFTTIQKFLPDDGPDAGPYTDRRNVVVIADEAHRSQYGFIRGLARRMHDALPGATFVGFTGTPVELEDKDTRAVFGDYIDVYDIHRAVEDGATVPIFYESRLAQLELEEDEKPRIDEDFEEVTEGEEVARVEKLKSKWAQLEAVVGTEKRLALVAEDLVAHFEERLGAMDGKAMVVCMSRRICVDLHDAIVKLRPEWESENDEAGAIKVVMTGSASDPAGWQRHIRNKPRRERLADRFRDPDDPFKVVIVRDMWLTGFDAPSLHSMYVDKPMRGHALMQAIARVNRVFRDKPGGLVVDYLGLADDLRKALAVYAQSGGRGATAIDQSEAVALMLERYEVCRDLFHGFDYAAALKGTPGERMRLPPAALEHILAQPDRKDRFVKAVVELSKAFALAVPRAEALEIRDEVVFFQTVKAALVKTAATRERSEEDLDHAIRQIVSAAIAPQGVIDVFEAAGLPKPDISILSDEFMAEVRELPQKNLAVELLQRLLRDELRTRARKSLVQSRAFSEMLEATIRRYQNRAIETAQVIEELIVLAREMREAQRRGESLGLSDEELAFYDALETNDSAVAVLGDDTLRVIARELADTVRRNATIDWTVRESARARLRVMVRRILRKYGYPPDKQERATLTVLEQAELLGLEWAAEPVTAAPFRLVPPEEARPYENCIPLYSLAVAAGVFSEAQEPEPEGWVAVDGLRPARGLFVAQVFGESMNRRIPNGAYCVFRTPVEGSRDGRVLLVEHREIADPDTGGRYTVKVYRSEKAPADAGGWRHGEIRLEPDTTAAEYEPIVLHAGDGDLRVIAELVAVLGA